MQQTRPPAREGHDNFKPKHIQVTVYIRQSIRFTKGSDKSTNASIKRTKVLKKKGDIKKAEKEKRKKKTKGKKEKNDKGMKEKKGGKNTRHTKTKIAKKRFNLTKNKKKQK